MTDEHMNTVVIGGGQPGLALGSYLSKLVVRAVRAGRRST
jgi:cation diffusion facilitator CzcD-associated flavoprotein CzcO